MEESPWSWWGVLGGGRERRVSETREGLRVAGELGTSWVRQFVAEVPGVGWGWGCPISFSPTVAVIPGGPGVELEHCQPQR